MDSIPHLFLTFSALSRPRESSGHPMGAIQLIQLFQGWEGCLKDNERSVHHSSFNENLESTSLHITYPHLSKARPGGGFWPLEMATLMGKEELGWVGTKHVLSKKTEDTGGNN